MSKVSSPQKANNRWWI